MSTAIVQWLLHSMLIFGAVFCKITPPYMLFVIPNQLTDAYEAEHITFE